jgi:hypothetical protein
MKQKDGKPAPDKDEVQGEGDYEAARRYNEAAREHARSADVEGEARDAEPASPLEERELERAEDEGRARAKEEDALLDEPERIERNPARAP